MTRLYGQLRRATAAGKTGEVKRAELKIATIEALLQYGVSRKSMARKLKCPMRVIDQKIAQVRKRWTKKYAETPQVLRLRAADGSELTWASLTAEQLQYIVDHDGRLPLGVTAERLFAKK